MDLRIDELSHGKVDGNQDHGQHESQRGIFQKKKEKSQEGEKHGQHIDKENSTSLVFRDSQEPVMEVFLIRPHNPFVIGTVGLAVQDLFHTPAPDRQENIEKRHPQDKDRNKNSRRGSQLIGGQDPGSGKNVAQEHGAHIPHKDPGGIEIIAEKTSYGPGQDQQHHRIEPHTLETEHHGQGNRCHNRQSPGQSIHPVNQIKGIDKSHKPDDGENQGKGFGERNTEHGIQADTQKPGKDSHGNVYGQFHQGMDIVAVIQVPHQRQQAYGTGNHPQKMHIHGPGQRNSMGEIEEYPRDKKRENKTQSAPLGSGHRMNMPPAGGIHQADQREKNYQKAHQHHTDDKGKHHQEG